MIAKCKHFWSIPKNGFRECLWCCARKAVAALAVAIVAIFTLSAAVYAETPPTPAQAVPAGVGEALTKALLWIDQNATVSTGYGITLRGGHGATGILLKESVTVYDWTLRYTRVTLDLAHATLFSQPVNHSQIGLSVTWALFSTPQAQAVKDATPVLRKLPLNLKEIVISPYIGLDVDRLVAGNVDAGSTAVGLTAGWKF